jgi:hypothetical protein
MSATICLCCGGELSNPDSSNPNLCCFCFECAHEPIIELPRPKVPPPIPIALPEPVVELSEALN